MTKEDIDRTVALAASSAYLEGYNAGRLSEREECAKVCENMSGPIETYNPKYVHYIGCAAAIRARGETQ